MKKILLVSMPFGALERQALGLSLFKARLTASGIPCDLRYLTFTFADLLGVEEYRWLSTEIPHTAFVGEWLFTPCLYGADAWAEDSYVRSVLQDHWHLDACAVERILRAKAMAQHFIDHCLLTVPWSDYTMVGFTSTFEQNIASLALAKRVKTHHPHVKTVFGGANWEEEMGLELHRCFPFVDYAFSGEADESFPKFVQLMLSGHLTSEVCETIPGLIHRRQGISILNQAPKPVQNLDALPIPDYGDYFRDLDHSSASSTVLPTLLFEGGRGCWWGAQQHCRFCGLNGATMQFRAKSSERALEEIGYLVQRWQIDQIQAVDNVVPMHFFHSFFPALAKVERPVRFFYEIRANLSRKQVQALRTARVVNVQPGIESFSDPMLALMRKGTTALQNIQLLKWCKEYGIQADYNLLYGLPGETEEDYEELFRLLPSLRFLGAPTACGPIRLDRFSPYYRAAHLQGFRNVKPMLPYAFLYPFGEASVGRIAYYFDYAVAPGMDAPHHAAELVHLVEDWQAHPEAGTLQAFERPDGTLALLDTRSCAIRPSVVLRGIDKAVYDYCDCVQSLGAICGHLTQRFPNASAGTEAVRSFLEALVRHGYMLGDDSGYLSLALRSESAIQGGSRQELGSAEAWSP